MTNPCEWCDGKTVWDGSGWTEAERCPDEDYCEYYKQYLRQREEIDFLKSEIDHGAIRPGIYAEDLLEDFERFRNTRNYEMEHNGINNADF